MGLITDQTPPASTDLTRLETAFAELDATSGDDDAYVAGLIKRASGVIASHCGRTFGMQTITESFRNSTRTSLWNVATYGTPLGTNYAPILLTGLPVASIASVVESGTTLSTDDYEYEAETGILWRLYNNFRNPWLLREIIVTYTAGYVLPTDTGTRTLPQAIEEVCLSLIRAAYFARGSDPRIIREQVEGVGLNQYALSSPVSAMVIDDNSRSILAPYRRRV